MVSSPATTVARYLASFGAGERKVLVAVRKLVRQHLPKGYKETMNFGMINWAVPLSPYPDTYNGQPLCYAALAKQKRHFSLYLTCGYGSRTVLGRLRAGYKKAGKQLNMGKSCIRFTSLDDLAPEAIAKAIASVPVDALVAAAERVKPSRK